MSWRDLSYWARGGIIGVIVSIIPSFLYFYCLYVIKPIGFGGLACITPILPAFLFSAFFLGPRSLDIEFMWYIGFHLISIVIYFLIGALIGIVIGKIKQKRMGAK